MNSVNNQLWRSTTHTNSFWKHFKGGRGTTRP